MKVIYTAIVAMAGLDVVVWKGAVMAELSTEAEVVLHAFLEWFRR